MHELRAPLGLMVSAARAAAEECGHGTAARRHVEIIERTGLRLLASAQQVLYVELAERYADEAFDPCSVAREWIVDAIELGQRVAATLHGGASWKTEQGNAGQLLAILQSMLSNALDHGPRTGTIDVRLSASQARLVVEVSNPIGPARHKGLGLGTAVCHRLADLLGAEFSTASDQRRFKARLVLSRIGKGPAVPCPRLTEIAAL